MGLALDTNAYSALQRGVATQLKQFVSRSNNVAITLIVIAELKAGFQRGIQTAQNMAKLERFLQDLSVDILVPDQQTTDIYAELWAELKSNGTPIPTNDVWIGALCLQHNYPLATNDKHFKQVPLLQTIAF